MRLERDRAVRWWAASDLRSTSMDSVVHFEIHADDPERAIRFYTGAFGWSISQMGSEDYWLATTAEDGQAGINGAILRRRGPRPEVGAPIVGAVITVQVADLDATVQGVLGLGGDLALDKTSIPGVGTVAFVHDTEANVLGLFQPIG